ncbi:MAG: MFS transporter [Actinomycetota bacterium]
MTEAAAPLPTRRPSWRTFAAVGAAMVLTALNFSISFVAFGEIASTFDAAGTTVSWALTAFSITIGALTVPGGWAADRYGRAQVFVTGLAIFVIGSGLVAVAPTVETLIAARVVQAAGVAVQSPAMLALMLDAFGPSRRATAVGLTGGLGGIAAAAGPAVGGALVESVGWRWTFAANVPIGIVVFVVLLRTLRFESSSDQRAVPDLVGAALLVGAVAGFILGIVQSDDWGFGDGRTLGAVAGAFVLGVWLIRRSAAHPSPILDLGLFSVRSFRAGAVLQLLVAGSFGGVFLTQLQFLTDGWDYTLLEAGLVIAAIPAIAGPLTVVSGRLADRHGHRTVIVPGMVCMIAAGLLLATTVSADRSLWTVWIPVNVLYSLGVGLAHAACQAVAVSEVAETKLGIGAAMSRISQEIGNAVTAAAAITLIERAANPVNGLRWTMVLLIGFTVAALPIAWRLPRRGAVTPVP